MDAPHIAAKAMTTIFSMVELRRSLVSSAGTTGHPDSV
jgi:hypothetical protein